MFFSEVRTVILKLGGENVLKRYEVRKDPITGVRVSIIDKEILLQEPSQRVWPDSSKDCPFCAEYIEDSTPSFEDGSRIVKGDVVLFPNLYPYAKHCAVAVFKEHEMGLKDFTVSLLKDAFEACASYLKGLDDSEYMSINMNYLYPSGCTVLHPHMQVISDTIPTTYVEIANAHSSDFWEEYIIHEKNSSRYLGECEGMDVIASFAPLGYFEVMGIRTDWHSLNDVDFWEGPARVLYSALQYYNSMNRDSFNMALYMAPEGSSMPFHMRVCSRSTFGMYYRSDVGYMERLHLSSVVPHKPEELRDSFKLY